MGQQYFVTSTVSWEEEGWTATRSIPTFVLDSSIQGVVDVEHAEKIARSIIDPFGRLASVSVTVVAIDDGPVVIDTIGIIEDGKVVYVMSDERRGLREEYSDYITKFDGPMSCYMHSKLNEGTLVADDEVSNGQGEWRGRFGRRVLCEDDRGFVWCHKFYGSERMSGVDAAKEYMDERHAEWYDDEDDMVMSGGRGPEPAGDSLLVD